LLVKAIEIEGFKSYAKKQILDFTKYDKLVFVTGENVVEPTLSANGVGKSSLFEALSWVLFGKTSTNLKAGDIKNWYTNIPCSVVLKFCKGGTDYTLKRTWNPNTLTLNGETIAQQDLEKLVELNFEAFSFNVFISQFGEKFVDYTPADKMKIFSQIMGDRLTIWDKFSDTAKSNRDIVNDELTDLKLDMAKKSGEIVSLENLNYDDLIVEFEVFKGEKLEKLNSEIENLLKQNTSIDTAKEIVEDLTISISNLKDNYKTIVSDSAALQKVIDELRYDLQHIKFILDNNADKIKELTSLDTKCPTCLQPIDRSIVAKNLKSLETEVDAYNIKYNDINSKLADNELKYKELVKNAEGINSLITKKQAELLIASKKVTELDVIADNRQKTISKLKKEIVDLINTENPYIKQKDNTEQTINELKKQLDDLTNQFNNCKELFEIYKYWVNGFKEIKLLLTERALKEFEVEINNNLQKLGLVDWTVKLAIDSENKSGTIRKGFTILVQSPINASLVPFECWSGGEAQRLRLAVSLGLVDFIRNRSAEPCNILVLDEPTQFLSDTGIEDLLATLKDKAVSDNITIFLIDHRNLKTSGVFEHIINIRKDSNGTLIL